MAALPALLVNVTTAVMVDVLPIAVLGKENVAGLTVNCDEAGGAAAPIEPGMELELDVDEEEVTLDATDGRGRLLHPAVSATDASITATETQWLRQWSIRDSHLKAPCFLAKASNPAWTGARRSVNL
jgi:hypothetical protein